MLKLKDFQSEAVNKLVEMLNNQNKKEIVMQSPTGSGKTIILSIAVQEFMDMDTESTCFFWFSPGNGELEEQSKDKFSKIVHKYDALSLEEAIRNGFKDKQIVFVNWEMLDKGDNKALREQETKNLKDRIEECRASGTNIKIIKDESHTHNTKIADNILSLFGECQIIKVSATIDKKVDPIIDIDIDEDEVIQSGLITKLISINEGISEHDVINVSEEEMLINLALAKQKEIANGYREIGLDLVPLIIVQYPNETNKKEIKESSVELMERVEYYLESKGYSYDNGLCACWLDGNKKNIDSDNQPLKGVIILHTKQALATGWDCPRAKILVKLRDNMNETFEIQVLGRIRRMPEQKHYDNELLNNCYLYTFDEKYKEAAIKSYGGKEAKILYIKEEYKDLDLGLLKENRSGIESSLNSDRKKINKVCSYIIEKYKLEDIHMSEKDTTGYQRNRAKLEKVGDGEGYDFDNKIRIQTVEGEIAHSSDLLSSDEITSVTIKQNESNESLVKKHNNANRIIASSTGLSDKIVRAITKSLFLGERMQKKKKRNRIRRVLNLKKREYRIFVINNRKQLIKDIKASRYDKDIHPSFPLTNIEKSSFKIPAKDIVYLDDGAKFTHPINENVYQNYTSDITRSLPEKRFENYIEMSGNVKWFYKNGDKGQKYLSIVYYDNLNEPNLFYPDYLLMTNDERLFIIEVKGGEDTSGHSKNIDKEKVDRKFEALKKYVENHNTDNPSRPINFAFVRDIEYKNVLGDVTHTLFYDNTKWSEEMGFEWKPLKELFDTNIK